MSDTVIDPNRASAKRARTVDCCSRAALYHYRVTRARVTVLISRVSANLCENKLLPCDAGFYNRARFFYTRATANRVRTHFEPV